MPNRPHRRAPRHAHRRVHSACCALVLILGAANASYAVSVDRTTGVGFEQTLTALPQAGGSAAGSPSVSASGLVLQYWVRHVGFEAIIGGHATAISAQPLGWGAFIALGAHYNVFRAPMVNLSAGLRFVTGLSRSVDVTTGAAKAMQVGFSVEVPLRAMFFLSDHFALTGAVGPVVVLGSSGGNPLTGLSDTTSFSLFRGGFSGGLGFVVVFR